MSSINGDFRYGGEGCFLEANDGFQGTSAQERFPESNIVVVAGSMNDKGDSDSSSLGRGIERTRCWW